jgi:addiction module HigA family antidote
MCFSIALVDNSRQWLVVPGLLQPTEPTIGADMRRTKLLPNPHPGEILAEESLKPMELSQTALARAIGVPPLRINETVLGKRADTDLRLARYLKITPPAPPESWPSCAFPCGSS